MRKSVYGIWGKTDNIDNPEDFKPEGKGNGRWEFINNYDGNLKSNWNNKSPKLFDLKWDEKNLLIEFSCDGEKIYTFNLNNPKNKEIGNFVYIKSVNQIKYYLKINKSDLVDFKVIFSKCTCN